ncbi:MAG: hypothetical protein LW857_06385 [Verrucomicrobiae bacterium]|nr:hypothetical protein [Verrucomicrobiae bacterium]
MHAAVLRDHAGDHLHRLFDGLVDLLRSLGDAAFADAEKGLFDVLEQAVDAFGVRVGLLDRADRRGDQAAEEVLLAHDDHPMRGVGGRGHLAGQFIDVGGAAGGIQAPIATQLLGQRDLVDARVFLRQLDRGRVDVLVLRIEEKLGGDLLGKAALQRFAVDDDARDQPALGVEVMGRHTVAVVRLGVAAVTLVSVGHGRASAWTVRPWFHRQSKENRSQPLTVPPLPYSQRIHPKQKGAGPKSDAF